MKERTRFGFAAVGVTSLLLLADGMSRGLVEQVRPRPSARAGLADRPNFEGVWAYGTSTPLERPQQFADRPYFSSDAEAEKFRTEAEAARRAVQASRLGVPEFVEDEQPFIAEGGRKPTSLINDPADGRIPYLNPSAQRQPLADRFAGPTDFPLSERCVKGQAGPPMLPSAGPPHLQIVQTHDLIAFLQEGHDVRLAPFDGRLDRTAIRRWYGTARGWWEGGSLVVESSSFRSQRQQRNPFVRFDENLRVVERLSFIDSNTLRYEFTVDDPTVFARPWSGRFSMRRQVSPMFEFACHEGNYALPNILRGARSQERIGAVER